MAKKKAKKRPGTPGIDPNERRRERLEARRAEKARALAAQRRRERRERLVRIALLSALAVAAFWFIFLRGSTPDAIAGHAIETFPEGGVNQHTNNPVPYEETPPVAGQHSPSVAPCGIHSEQIPDETYVHSLEHGAVAILYDPAQVDAATIEASEEIAASYDGETISAPYEGMDQPIYVTSWGERMPLESLDRPAVREYIDTFRAKGPEPGAECPNTSEDPFDTSALPGATPSPEPNPDATKEDN